MEKLCQYRRCGQSFSPTSNPEQLYCRQNHKRKEDRLRRDLGADKAHSALAKNRQWARRIKRGVHLKSYDQVHKGMAQIKIWQGDPRPFGLTHSLICYPDTCSDNYLALDRKGCPRRVCINPDHYVWEDAQANLMRSA